MKWSRGVVIGDWDLKDLMRISKDIYTTVSIERRGDNRKASPR